LYSIYSSTGAKEAPKTESPQSTGILPQLMGLKPADFLSFIAGYDSYKV
jgi:hypothetical protein